jgi:hypothetical protein
LGLAAAAVVAAAFGPQAGCSSSPEAASVSQGGEVGTLGMSLQLPGNENLGSVQWIISGPTGAVVQTGAVPVQGSASVAFTVANLPAGPSYKITLSGTTVDGLVTCSGSASFTVLPRVTSAVTLLLRCNAPTSEAGSVAVSAPLYACATINALSEVPSETTVGNSVSFQASANGPNTGDITYTWSAPSGTFSYPAGPNTTFTCTTSGTVPVTLTVADGPVPEGGACDPTLSTQTVPVVCDSGCPAIASLDSGVAQGYVGDSITLTAAGIGTSPASLGYTWSVSSGNDGGTVGVLGQPQDEAAGPTDANSFLCTAPGTATVTVVVDDGQAADAGTACPASAATASTTITCLAYPAGQVNSAWVELGPGGAPVARAITAATSCPNIVVNGVSQAMTLRIAAGTEPLRSTTSASLGAQYSKPSAFPVNTCEYYFAAGSTSANATASVAGFKLPLPPPSPTRVIVLGDTGCRMKAAIPASGSQFQGCNDPSINGYPFQTLATLAASFQPDVVLHVGDYQYRENECPPNQANCAGSPWGYGWDTWRADFFQPAAALLGAAPWIVTRGNHEQCTRAGQGWFRFLDPNPYSEQRSCNSAANDAVLQPNGTLIGGAYSAPYNVPLGTASQVLVFDSNNVGSSAVTPGGSSNFIEYQTEIEAAGAFASAASASNPNVFNIWSNHHPILGFAPNAGAAPSPGNADLLSVMAATYPNTYFPPNVNLVLHGHTHIFEAIDLVPTNSDAGAAAYPATVVTGNAGTLLDIALPDPFSQSVHPDLAGNVTVNTIIDSAGFGFLFMQYNAGPNTWTITEYRIDGTVRSVCTASVNGQMTCAVNGTQLSAGQSEYVQ